MHLMQWRSRPTTTVSPFNFSGLQQEISRMFEHLSNLSQFGLSENGQGAVSLSLDIKEEDQAIVVTAEMPGVDIKDVQVAVKDDYLIVKGEKRSERHEKEDNYVCVERTFGGFERRVRLPNPVDPNQAEAIMENGVLTLRLPKVEVAGTKTIPIRGGTGKSQMSGLSGQPQSGQQQQFGGDGGQSGQSGQQYAGQSSMSGETSRQQGQSYGETAGQSGPSASASESSGGKSGQSASSDKPGQKHK